MIWHFLEVWGLLLAAFALGGLLGTLLYMGLAVSPLADAQITVADAIADRFAAIREFVERRRDAGLYRGQREAPAYVIPLPVPLSAPPPYDEADPATAEEDPDAHHWEGPAETQVPVAATADAYWEDDDWAPDEDDAQWPEDDYWSEADARETSAAGALPLPDIAGADSEGVELERADLEEGDVGEALAEPYSEAFLADPADPVGAFVRQGAGEAALDDQPDAEEGASELLAGTEDESEDETGEAVGRDDPVGQASDEEAVDAVVAVAPPDADEPSDAEMEPVAAAVAIPEGGRPPDDDAPAVTAHEAASDPEAEPTTHPQAAEPADPAEDPGDAQSEDGQPGDGQPGDGQPGDGQPGDGQPGNMDVHGASRPMPAVPAEPVSRADTAPVVTLPVAEGAITAGRDADSAAVVAASILALATMPTERPARPPPVRRPAARPSAPATPPPGTRPLALNGPRNGVPDNLQKIRGIGHKNEALLHSLGIFHFGQIAAWTPAEAEWVASQLAFPERLERDDWIGQAIIIATGGDTGHVKAGERRKGDDESPVAA